MHLSKNFFYRTVFFLIGIKFTIVESQLNFTSNEYANRVNEALQTFFPRNILNNYRDIKFNNISRIEERTKCDEQLDIVVDSIMKGEEWALKMIDASSKIPSGILMGNRIDLGMYDECVAIRALDEIGEEIRGRHCMYQAAVPLSSDTYFSQSLSICLPATCDADDVRFILNRIIAMIPTVISIPIDIHILNEVTCSSIETSDWTVGGILTLVGFSLLLLFLTISTICDAQIRRSKKEISPNSKLALIAQFSVYSNGLRILSTRTTPDTLPALQGIRFFSMCWVIIGHEYFMSVFGPTINAADMLEWVGTWDAVWIMIAPFAVDTFFTLSGFLISYLFLKEMSKGRRFNIFEYYIHRYIRLTPALAALLLINIFIFPRIGSGALWQKFINQSAENCRNNWWPMLLYVHNYVNKKDLGCLSHTWYLAAEMQFFVLSPFVLYPMAKKPKFGLTILGILFIASIITPAKISYDNKYSSALFATKDIQHTMETVSHFYMETHIRATAYIIGIYFGYLIFTHKGTTKKATKWIGWLLAVASFSFCIFSFKKFQQEGYEYEPVWETFYAAVARPLWSFGVAWVIYACIRGFGGPVTTILSLSIFHPFSRISYCIYLIHYVIQMMKIGALRTPRYFNDFTIFNYFLSDFLLCVIFGFLCSLLFESPILTLEKIITKKGKRKADELKKELKDEKIENGIDNPALTIS